MYHPRKMSLAEYRSLFATISPPTDEQLVSFVDYVSTAHSWYKRGLIRDITLCFFLDGFLPECAAHASMPPQLREQQGFFIGDSAAQNRERFHCFNYCIVEHDDRSSAVPHEIPAAAIVTVSGAIHQRIAWIGLWKRFPWLRDGVAELEEPLRQQLADRIRYIDDHWEELCRHDSSIDSEVARLLSPRREHERAQMISALERVRALLYD